jgi:hypothetical protein
MPVDDSYLLSLQEVSGLTQFLCVYCCLVFCLSKKHHAVLIIVACIYCLTLFLYIIMQSSVAGMSGALS